jgi:microcystin degradation protein MlrC
MIHTESESKACMIRIAIGGLMHESNTFARAKTDRSAFEAGGLETGDAIFARWGNAHHEVAGFFDAAAADGFAVVPTLMGWATPAGPLTANCYVELTAALLHSIDQAGPVDAVVLALHGAMVADGQRDADGTILCRVRDLIGPGRTLVATLDYHGNVSAAMVQATDALVGYRTYPHIDQRARGQHAVKLAARAARGEIRPVQALAKPPIMIPILAQDTSRPPMSLLMERVETLDRQPRVLDASLWAGFAYADVPAAGAACVVVADGDQTLADGLAASLADDVWTHRRELTASPLPAVDAIALALASTDTPVVLVDLGDNIGGGSAADSTVLWNELLRQQATGAVVVLYDPEAARACAAAGTGARVSLEVGGKIDCHSPPARIAGRVVTIHLGRYEEELPRHGGIRHNDQGLTAVIATDDSNTVVVNSLRHPPFSLGQLTSLGIRPERARILVVKAAVAYKAAYAPIARRLIEVDTPGLTAANPCRFHYEKVRRPILPLDPELAEVPSWR